jgi:hypothetical protein
MPKGGWTDNDISTLKSLASKLPIRDIAAELGRSPGATILKAHQLRLSLRVSAPSSTQRRTQPAARLVATTARSFGPRFSYLHRVASHVFPKA